uniref:Polyprotein n=1 Tax=Phaseolus vulgaris alphaendornavirus 2 TaxID=1188793 RepID=A0A6M3QBZ5_9VIRU|nr:polyprotein [Phaseolus vulgaris alphaendornavirus 2]
MARKLDKVSFLKSLGGSHHPKIQASHEHTSNRVLMRKLNKRNECSARNVYRQSNYKVKLHSSKTVVPAVMAARQGEELEFLEFGYEECVPDLNKIDIRTIRSMMQLFEQGHCHIDITPEEVQATLHNCQLQSTEPYYGAPGKLYYKHCRPLLTPRSKEDGTTTEAARDLLLGIIKKFGGSVLGMLYQDCANNANMTPHVYRQGNRYGFKAMEMAQPDAATLCCYCKTVNFVWLYGETDGLQKSRCGVCMTPLLLEHAVPEHIMWPILTVHDITQLHVGATELQNAAITLQLDGQPPITTKTMSKLIEQDFKNMRSIMSRAMAKTVYVPNGMTDFQHNHLTGQVPAYKLIRTNAMPNPHAMLAAERRIATIMFADKRGPGQTILDVGSRKNLTGLKEWHGMGPIMDWRDVERYNDKPLSTNICDHTVRTCECMQGKKPMVMCIDSIYDIDPCDVLKLMHTVQTNQLFFCVSTAEVDFESTSGLLAHGQGMWSRHKDKLVTSLRGDDRPYVNSWKLTKLWSTADLIQIDQVELNLQTIKVLGNHLLRVLTIVPSGMDCLRTRQLDHRTMTQVDLVAPVIDVESWLNVFGVPKISYKLTKLDLQLYRALYSRNLTGSLSFNKLIEFGLGYAHVKYTTRTSTITHHHISADDIRLHAMLACVATRRKFAWVKAVTALNTTSNAFGLDPIEVVKLMSIDLAGKLVNEIWGALLPDGALKSKLSGMVDTVKAWINDPFWDVLEQLNEGSKRFEPNVVVWPMLTAETSVESDYVCCHHNLWCEHEAKLEELCECCRLATKLSDSQYCLCCRPQAPKHKCEHHCYGNHGDVKQKGGTDCTCCGLRTINGVCKCCVNKLGKWPTQQEGGIPLKYRREEIDKAKKIVKSRTTTQESPQTAQKTPPAGAASESGPTPHADKPSDEQNHSGKITEESQAELTILDKWKQGQASSSGTKTDVAQGISSPNQQTMKSDGQMDQHAMSTEDEVVFNELKTLTTLDYACNVRYGYTYTVTEHLGVPNECNPLNLIGISELKYLPIGKKLHPPSWLTVMDRASVPGDGICGFHAINRVLGGNLSLVEMQRVTRRQTEFSADELLDYLAYLGKNGIILTKDTIASNKIDPFSDQYVCVRHCETDPNPKNHWEPCTVIQTEDMEYTPCFNGLFKQSQVNTKQLWMTTATTEIEHKNQVMRIVLELIKRAQPKQSAAAASELNLKLIDTLHDTWMSNNATMINDPAAGLFHYKIRAEDYEYLACLINRKMTADIKDDLIDPLNIGLMHDTDIDQLRSALLRNVVYQCCLMLNEGDGTERMTAELWTSMSIDTTKVAGGLRMLQLGDTKVKTGDVISVNTISGPQHRLVWKHNGRYFCKEWMPPNHEKLRTTLHICRQSFKSAMIQMYCLSRNHIEFDKFKQLVEMAVCTLGPAGSGKTTRIARDWTTDDLAIARTTVAVTSLREKLNSPKQLVMSHEKYSFTQPPTHRLVIDECTMFPWYELYFSLTTLPTSLVMYGDPNQISTIDTYMLGGERILDNIADYVPNKTLLKSTYRYGPKLCGILNSIVGEIVSNAPHDTMVLDLNLPTWDDSKLTSIIHDAKPDVVLVHHNVTKRRIGKLLTTIKVETIHSYQSKEANAVLVVQYNEGGNSQIYMNKNYAVSAATRCKTKLVWVSVGLPDGMKLVDKLKGSSLDHRGEGLQDAIELTPNTRHIIRQAIDNGAISPATLTILQTTQLRREQIEIKPEEQRIERDLFTMEDVEKLVQELDIYNQRVWTPMDWGEFKNRWRASVPPGTKLEVDDDRRVLTAKVWGCTVTVTVQQDMSKFALDLQIPFLMRLAKSKIEKQFKQHYKDLWISEAMGRDCKSIIMDLRPEYRDDFARIVRPALMTNMVRPIQNTQPSTSTLNNDKVIVIDWQVTDDESSDGTQSTPRHAGIEDCGDNTLGDVERSGLIGASDIRFLYPVTNNMTPKQASLIADDTNPHLLPVKSIELLALVRAALPTIRLTVLFEECDNGYNLDLVSEESKVAMFEVTQHNMVVRSIGGTMKLRMGQLLLDAKLKVFATQTKRGGIWNRSPMLTDEQTQIVLAAYPWMQVYLDLDKAQDENVLIKHISQLDSYDYTARVVEFKNVLARYDELSQIYSQTGELVDVSGVKCCGPLLNESVIDAFGNANTVMTLNLDVGPTSNRIIRLLSEWTETQYDMGQMAKLDVLGSSVVMATYGGCTLCAGIKFSSRGVDLMKVGRQSTAISNRCITIYHHPDMSVTAALCHGLHLNDKLNLVTLGPLDYPPDLLADLDDTMKEPWFELGMIFERMSHMNKWLSSKMTGVDSEHTCDLYGDTNHGLLNDLAKQQPKLEIPLRNNVPTHRSLLNRPFKAIIKGHQVVMASYEGIMYCSNTMWAMRMSMRFMPLDVMIQRSYTYKANSWPWRLARFVTLNGSLANMMVGYDDETPTGALNLPLEYHENNKTIVHRFLCEKREEVVLSTMKKTHHVVFVSRSQLQNYGSMISRDCAGLPVEEQGCDTIDQGFDLLVEQMCLKYYYNSIEKGEGSVMVTDFPYLSLLTSSWGNFCIPGTNGGGFRYYQNLVDCNNMMEKMSHVYCIDERVNEENKDQSAYYKEMQEAIDTQIRTGTGPWFTNSNSNEPARITPKNLMGLVIAKLPCQEIASMMRANNLTSMNIILPQNVQSDNQLFGIATETRREYQFWYHNSNHLTTINKELLHMFMTGKCITTKYGTLVSHGANRVLGHCIVKLTLLQNAEMAPKYVRPIVHDNQKKQVVFKLPVIANFKMFLNGGEALIYKEVDMSLKMYRALSLRMLRPDTTIDDLLSYARTYSHTVAYSISKMTSQQPQMITKLMECCVCVFLESTRLNNATTRLTELINSTEFPLTKLSGLKDMAWFATIKMVTDVYKWLGVDVGIEQLLEMVSTVAKEAAGRIINNIDKLKAVRVSRVEHTDPLIMYDASADQTVISDHGPSKPVQFVQGIIKTLKLGKAAGYGMARSAQNLRDPRVDDLVAKPLAISKVVKQLEEHIGENKVEALREVMQDLHYDYPNSQLMEALIKVMENIDDELKWRDMCYFGQIMRGEWHTVSANLAKKLKKPVNTCITLNQLDKEIKELQWMYPTECNHWKGKKIVFSTIGSRGDIEPYIAWAQVVAKLGSECKFLVPKDYVDYVNSYGFEALGLQVDSSKLINSCIQMEKHKWNPLQLYNELNEMFEIIEGMFKLNTTKLLQFCEGVNMIIETPFTHVGVQVAQKLRAPCLFSTAYPWEQQAGMTTRADSATIIEMLTGIAAFTPFRKHIEQWRHKTLQLHNPRGIMAHGSGNPLVYLHPKLTTWWKTSNTSACVGYANSCVKQVSEQDVELTKWAAEAKTIAVCFGSMTGDRRSSMTTKLMLSMQSQYRFLVVDGQTSYDQIKFPNMRQVSSCNYNLLFNAVEIVVTHGGSGTTHNALQHGCCVIIDPHFGDQFAWLKSVEQLGCGTSLEKLLKLDVNEQISKLQQYTDTAQTLGGTVRAENFMVNLITNSEVLWQAASDHTTNLLANVVEPLVSLDLNCKNINNQLASGGLGKWADVEDTTVIITAEGPKFDKNHNERSNQMKKGTGPQHNQGSSTTVHPQTERNPEMGRNYKEYQSSHALTYVPTNDDLQLAAKAREERKEKKKQADATRRKIAVQLAEDRDRRKEAKEEKEEATQLRLEQSELSKELKAAASLAIETNPEGEPDETHTLSRKSKEPKYLWGMPKDEDAREKEMASECAATATTEPPAAVCVITTGTTIEPESVESQGERQAEPLGKAQEQCGTMDPEKLYTRTNLIYDLFEVEHTGTNYAPFKIMSPTGQSVVLNPNEGTDCVFECLRVALTDEYTNDEDKSTIILRTCYQWLNIQTMPTTRQLEGLVRALHLHIGVQLPSCSIDFPIGSATIEQVTYLEIIEGVLAAHCVLKKVSKPSVEFYTASHAPQMSFSVNVMNAENAAIDDGLEPKLTMSSWALDLFNDSKCERWWAMMRTNYTYAEFMHKLESKNLVHTAKRMHAAMSVTNCTQSEHILTVDEKVVANKWYWVTDGAKWYGAISRRVNERSLLITTASHHKWGELVVMVRTDNHLGWPIGPTVRERLARKIVVPGNQDVTALNKSTLYESRCKNYGVQLKGVQDTSCEYVAVFDYDNRSHHKYDDAAFLVSKGPSKSIGLGFDLTGDMWAKITNRTSAVRHMLNRGKLTLCMEFVDHQQRNTFASVLDASRVKYTLEGGSVYLATEEVSHAHSNLIQEWAVYMNASNGLVIPDRTLMERLKVGVPLQELVDQICPDINIKSAFGKRHPSKHTAVLTNDHARVKMPLTTIVKTEMETQDKYLVLRSNCIICELLPLTRGGGEEEPLFWRHGEELKVNSVTRWWNQPETEAPKTGFNKDRYLQINSEALTNWNAGNTSVVQISTNPFNQAGDSTKMHYVGVTQWANVVDSQLGSPEIVDYDIMSMWDDTDFTDWNERFAPKNDVVIKSKATATEMRVTTKYTMVEYPTHSRPVLTKAANQEFNAVSGRLHNITTYRLKKYDLTREVRKFVDMYFDSSKRDKLMVYQTQQLTFNDAKVLDWLRDRPDSNKIAEELNNILAEGMQLHPINKLNVHLKLESLLKSEPASNLKQVKARALVWQCKGYCAIFSHVFKEVKVRLKDLLRPEIVYSDGLRADELAARVRLTTNVKFLLENDLAQQDKQTDHEIIKVEMEIYKLLGVCPHLVDLWKNCHHSWVYKSRTVAGVGDAMRLTGQATTAIGNAITNMLVHRRLVKTLGHNLRLFLVLGDDGLMFTTTWVDTTKLNNELKTNHNMMCKPSLSQTHGVFCCMMAAITDEGNCTLGPDVVRLRRRFECPNGVSEMTPDNVQARCMAYYMMLGATPEVTRAIQQQQLPIQPIKWYDADSIRSATMSKYNMDANQVLNEERLLLGMLREPNSFAHKILHWHEGQ